jgi:perosamine synthetase
VSLNDAIPLSRPDIIDSDRAAVMQVLGTDRLSIGRWTEAFERAIAARAGRKHGVAVNSGTSGLHLLVRALGLGEGDEVITTPFSFVATTNCLLFERAKPVFADIDADTYNVDPAALKAAITPRTKAILPVEVFGNMAHFDAYERIARSHGLKMIEDCCEALGGRLGGRSAGQFGDGGVFAYYPNKQITTGEGGMIVTDNDDVADLCRSMRNQGRDTKEWLQHARLGYNYRMSEITAALGAMQAARLDEILAKRRRSAELYQRLLAEIEEIHLPPMAEPNQASWFVFVIRLADRFSPAQRDELMQHLRGRGISCNPYFVPIHLQPYIQAALGTRVGQFPVTERVAARTIALPFFNALTEPQVLRIKAAIQEWLSHAE